MGEEGHGASIQQLQELLEVCVRVEPNAEHTADIRRQLEAAKQAKADARPMAAQLLAAERKVNKRKAAAENAAKRVADLEVQLGQARVDEADRRREFADAQTELAAVHRKALEAGPGLGAGERVDVRQLLPQGCDQVPGYADKVDQLQKALDALRGEAAAYAPTQAQQQPASALDAAVNEQEAKVVDDVLGRLLDSPGGAGADAAGDLKAESAKKIRELIEGACQRTRREHDLRRGSGDGPAEGRARRDRSRSRDL